ncbi:MAG: long-chain-acyl-CoA synthetase [Xanthobacteraceae bacterium]
MSLCEEEARPMQASRTGATQAWVRALEITATIAKNPKRTLPAVVQENAERFGAAPALLSDQECFSHQQLAERMNRYARWTLAHGIGKGDVVGLLMPNRPEYLAIWLGLSAVGAVVSLINTNLRDRSLAHCINIVAPKAVIVAAELKGAFESALAEIESAAVVHSHGAGYDRFTRIDLEVEQYSGAVLAPSERRDVNIDDRALYMYTSGTTGWPKAAIVDHRRLMTWSLWFAGMMDTGPADRMYNCLPLYHSVGGVVATGAVLVNGGSVVIREKFSAAQFWDDVRQWDCTLFQYIGELCRYLVNAAPHPRETEHRIRLCCGNGLRGDVWEAFKDRFRIPQILEFYAATEGSFSLFNAEGKPGAIGRVPSFLAHRFPVELLKVDIETGEPMRDDKGFCVRSAPNEPGHAIGRIAATGPAAGGRFEGYTNEAETQKKVLRNVFATGDAWFATGDLMRKDEHGYFYFVDRLGDTFRWKGENVATSEVAEAIAMFPSIADANVYGVAIPGTEGRAGMAAIVLKGPLDLASLRSHLMRLLPPYARPLFLRVQQGLDVTTTFKHQKSRLTSDGYDPSRIEDPLYFDHPARQTFVPLNAALYDDIRRGQIRV